MQRHRFQTYAAANIEKLSQQASSQKQPTCSNGGHQGAGQQAEQWGTGHKHHPRPSSLQ